MSAVIRLSRSQIIAGRSVECVVLTLLAFTCSGAAQAPVVARTKEQQATAWNAIAKLPDFWQGTWQSVSPIADEFRPLPQYTAFARDYIARYKPVQDSPFANCKMLGMPFAMSIGGMPIKFFQSPGMIALYIESSGVIRFIHTDGRVHSERPNPTYLGESIGQWEGDTLVVDTVGLGADTLFQMGKQTNGPGAQGDPSPMAGVVFGPHGPKLRLIERMRLVDFNTLEIQTTLQDETLFEKPYALPPRRFIRGIAPRNDPQEWACTDNRDRLNTDTGQLEIGVKGESTR